MREVLPTVPSDQIKAIFSLLVNHITSKSQNRGRFSILERLMMLSLFFLIAGIFLTVLKGPTVYGEISVSIGFLLASVLPVFISPGFVKMLLQPVRSALLPEVERAQLDSALVFELRLYEISSLKYVDERLRMAVDHFRSRIGTIAGAVDKVGLIPLLVGWFFAGEKFFQGATKSKYMIIGAGALVFFYVLSIIAVLASNRVEQLAQIVRFVLDNEKTLQRDAG
jgi:hypothetical protein